jgi:hypothetical protein
LNERLDSLVRSPLGAAAGAVAVVVPVMAISSIVVYLGTKRPACKILLVDQLEFSKASQSGFTEMSARLGKT